MEITGKINGIKYKLFLTDDLQKVNAKKFDINQVPTACKIKSKSPKPETAPSDKQKSYTTREEGEKEKGIKNQPAFSIEKCGLKKIYGK